MIADFYNIDIDNVKNLVPLFEARIKTKKIHRILEFTQSQWLKPYAESNTQKRIEAKKWWQR